MSNNLYNNDFYKDRADNTEYSARILSTFVVKNIGNIKSSFLDIDVVKELIKASLYQVRVFESELNNY